MQGEKLSCGNQRTLQDQGVELLEVCDECGFPLFVSSGLAWNADGTITTAGSPMHRMVFFESETIDSLFKGIEELIGTSIEHLVIESRARETKEYIEQAFSSEARRTKGVKKTAGEASDSSKTPESREALLARIKARVQNVIDVSRVYGYGDQRLSDLWETGGDFPWRTQIIRNPYSLLFIAADNVGSSEAFEKREMNVRYNEIEKDTYQIEVYPGEHPIELKERLQRKHYDLKPGDVDYERCPECGIPLEVASRKWNCEEGTYIDPETGRRMAIFGPSAMDAINGDLETELGDVIPEAIIEAQRQYLKSAWSTDLWNRPGSFFQHMIAIRGLGNLVNFEGGKNWLTLNIQNACLPLPMVGVVQALVELAYRIDSSTYEWEFTEAGDLNITIKVR